MGGGTPSEPRSSAAFNLAELTYSNGFYNDFHLAEKGNFIDDGSLRRWGVGGAEMLWPDWQGQF